MLFTNLEIDNVPPTNYLHRSMASVSPQQMNSRNIDISAENQHQSNNLSSSNQLKIAQLPDYITIDSKTLGGFVNEGYDLKYIVAQAVENAIKEIISPVISRSVTIALITTRELALKDFAMEPDEKKVLRGTHLIVQNLSGSLALVTCREPLKMSLCNHLKEYLDSNTNLDKKSKETIIEVLKLIYIIKLII